MQRKSHIGEGLVFNNQYVVLEKFDNKQHSSKIFKGTNESVSFLTLFLL